MNLLEDSPNNIRTATALERAYVVAATAAEQEVRSCRAIVVKHWRRILQDIERELKRGGSTAGVVTRFKDAIRAAAGELVQHMDGAFERQAELSFNEVDRATFESLTPRQLKSVEVAEAESDDYLLKKSPDEWPADRPIPPLPADPGKGQRFAKWSPKNPRKPNKTTNLKIIKAGKYKERMAKWSKQITDNKSIAETIAKGVAAGKPLADIAKQVEPHVRNLSSSAMRIVRTESARIHNEVAELNWKNYDNLIAGYRVINPLDERTRPEHRKRATEKNANGLYGRIYWKPEHKPKGAKYSAEDRPSLPDEPNCRCGYAPVFLPEDQLPKTVRNPYADRKVKDIEHDVDEETLEKFRKAERGDKPKKFRAGIRDPKGEPGKNAARNAKMVGTRAWFAAQQAKAIQRSTEKQQTRQVETARGKKLVVPKMKGKARVVRELPSNTTAARRGISMGSRVQWTVDGKRRSGEVHGFVRSDGGEDVMIFDKARGRFFFVPSTRVTAV